ncbi:MAG: DUF1292 domain-containing protein [Clostridia bacterium]|nr:DUF1292 domain-containing protein [Clostridia bacterium]
MHEMDGYFNELIDKLYDEENNEAIVLFSEKGQEIAFEQIAVIPHQDGRVYVILKPIQPIEGLGEDEGLVFFINDEKKIVELVTDEGIIDWVFSVYDSLVEDENE